jgi:enolase
MELYERRRSNPMSRLSVVQVKAREIIDCRGYPTLQVDVWTENGALGRADVPCGRSMGSHEAREVRDGGKRYHGRGVRKAVSNVNDVIGPAIKGRDVSRQRDLDEFMAHELDGTADKSKLGANAIVGVSLAIARAAAAALGLPLYQYVDANAHILPVPLINLIGGGKLGSSDLEIQEFHVVPVGAQTVGHALQMATEINEKLRELILAKYGKLALNTGDEGGFMPPMKGLREPLECLSRAVKRAGYEKEIAYGLDCAATHFYDAQTDTYRLDGQNVNCQEMIARYSELRKEFPIVSIEDPLYEDDWEGFRQITAELDIQIVGDDFFATNPERLRKGIELKAANALLWKVNQIGTLTEAVDAATLAFRNGYGVQVSERSGETEDPIIADLVVGLNAGQIKTGAPVRGERTSKYNRLLQIEEELGNQGEFAGRQFRQPVGR